MQMNLTNQLVANTVAVLMALAIRRAGTVTIGIKCTTTLASIFGINIFGVNIFGISKHKYSFVHKKFIKAQ